MVKIATQPPRDRRADRRHPLAAFADAAQAQAERRIDDAPRHQRTDEHDDEAVDVGGSPPMSKRNRPKIFHIVTPVQAVDAAGDRTRLVGRFEQHEPDAERHHQPRRGRLPRTTRKLDRRSRRRAATTAAASKPDERLVPAVHREQSRRIRADAEERGVAERHDAGVTEDQVERHARTAPVIRIWLPSTR